jgi:sugar-specific transcriptional regulator TrmB
MPYLAFEPDLKKLGLSDKEAAVYLSALGLGPSPVQVIARKAKVARATTYLVLESLMKRGLVTNYHEDKKMLYVAESPQHLANFLDHQEEKIKERRDELQELLPKLEAFVRTVDDRPVVRYYSGIEGLKTMRSVMISYLTVQDEWCNFSPIDHLSKIFGKDEFSYERPRLAKGIKSRTIFTTTSESLKSQLLNISNPRYVQRKFVSPERYKSASGFTIFRDRVAIGSFGKQLGGIVIESGPVAKMMQELFDITWENLDKAT